MNIPYINILPSLEELHKLLIYVPETGVLLWRPRLSDRRRDKIWNTRFANKPVGTMIRSGCILMQLSGTKGYLAKHVVWKMVTGDDPPRHLEPIDGNPSNHKFENLRKKELVRQYQKKLPDKFKVVIGEVQEVICTPPPKAARTFMARLETSPDSEDYEVVIQKDGVSMRLDRLDLAELLNQIPAKKWASTVMHPAILISKQGLTPVPNDIKVALTHAWDAAIVDNRLDRGAWRVTINKFSF